MISFTQIPIISLCAVLQIWTEVSTGSNIPSECSCGFSVNSTSSGEYAQFTDLLETDFLHLDQILGNECWQPQVYNVTAENGRGEYGKMAALENVVPNPLPQSSAWSGHGIHGGDPGLQLWVRSQVQQGLVPMGEILALRNDMKHGSYRVGMKVTHVPGTCGAFFWYRDNVQEIDMEFLSSSFNNTSRPVNLVMQTPESRAAGFNAAGTPTYDINQLPFVPSDGFHEYRFDWTENKVSFYADGRWIYDMNYEYPEEPGHLAFNHWSNGNKMWSAGPPMTDAVLTISYVKAYFNSSDANRQAAFEQNCVDRAQVCQIPELSGPPDQDAAGAQTHFFDGQSCGEYYVPPNPISSSSITMSSSGRGSTIIETATATATATVFAGPGTTSMIAGTPSGPTTQSTGPSTSAATKIFSTGVSAATAAIKPFSFLRNWLSFDITYSHALLVIAVHVIGSRLL